MSEELIIKQEESVNFVASDFGDDQKLFQDNLIEQPVAYWFTEGQESDESSHSTAVSPGLELPHTVKNEASVPFLQESSYSAPVNQGLETDDVIDYALVKKCSSLSYEEKCQIKQEHPRPPLRLEQSDGKSLRKFQRNWYEKYPWLTGSVVRDKLYCFSCLLFGGNIEWCKTGIMTVKNFERKAQKHQISQKHIQNCEQFHMLGRGRIEHALSEGARSSALKHNEKVKMNRHILGRCIDVVCFLGRQGLAFRGHFENETSLNKGNYLEILDLLAEEEIIMRDHLESNSVFKGTSSDIQNEIIATVTDVLNDSLRKEIAVADFIAVQVDDSTDVSCECQLSIILRYCIEDRIEERFVGFFDVSKYKTTELLSKVILDVIKQWKIETKLVCQTYDGASIMAGYGGGTGYEGGVHNYIKQDCPHALFIHCYAHQLNLVLLYGSKTIKQVRLFICNLSAFCSFFSRSARRTTLLTDQGFKVPSAVDTWWNYHSRAASTIKEHFQELRRTFTHIIDSPDWDPVTLHMARVLNNHLADPVFVFLVILFSRIFVFADHASKLLNRKCISDIKLCNNEMKALICSLKGMRNGDFVSQCCQESIMLNKDLIYPNESVDTLRALTYEIIDSQTMQLEIRFSDYESIDFVELVNKKRFADFKMRFPMVKLQQLLKTYPYFNSDQLKNELKIIYSDPRKYQDPQDLLKYIFNNDLFEVYQQLTKLLRLVLTLPLTSASSERNASALKQIKTYLRNSMENTQLSNLASLSIENKLLKSLSKDKTFKDTVIDKFAASKNRLIELTYKNI